MPKVSLIVLALSVAVAPAFGQTAPAPVTKSAAAKPAAAKPAVKPKPPAPVQRAASPNSADYWKIDYALPDPPKAVREPIDPKRGLGRVPLDNSPGSFGVGTLSDGRRPPGQEVYDQRSSSYVGLSLSVPSSSGRLPIPLPPIGRPE